jgi:hypothetical protein
LEEFWILEEEYAGNCDTGEGEIDEETPAPG